MNTRQMKEARVFESRRIIEQRGKATLNLIFGELPFDVAMP